MSFKRTAISLLAGLTVLAIGFTFFNKKSVDAGDLEQQLTTKLAAQRELGESQISVDCPSSEERKQGVTFDCDAVVAGKPLALRVEILDDDGNYAVTPSVPAEVGR